MVLQKKDASPDTALEKLKFMTFSFPALRFILHQVKTYVLPQSTTEKRRKLQLTEDIPLTAQFWEICVNFVYVECAVFYSGLTDPKRVELVAQFNNPNNLLLVLIIMHSVSSQEVNLDQCCSRVVVVTNARNAPLEWQNWGRIIRVFSLRVCVLP